MDSKSSLLNEIGTIEMENLADTLNSSTSSYVKLVEHVIECGGDIRQTVFCPETNNKKRTPLITYHDIGTNHNSFLGFFNITEMRILMQNFCVYHICAPGHEDQSSTLGNAVYPTMDELADMLNVIVKHFDLKYFVAFGMGAGSNVISRFALKYPKFIQGLFLINPNDTTQGYYQWFRLKWADLPQLRYGIVTDNLLNYLEDHWFGWVCEKNVDIVRQYEEQVKSLNPMNVAGFIQSYIDRTNLGLVRDLTINSDTNPIPSIKSDACLLSGELAQDQSRQMCEMNGRMNPKLTQFLSVPDVSGMIMEENPSKLAEIFLGFLRNISLVVSITPEMLREKAMKSHIALNESQNRAFITSENSLANEIC